MEMIYYRELGLTIVSNTKRSANNGFCLTDALVLYHRLKGGGKPKLFFEVSERSVRYLKGCLGHENLAALEISDSGCFRLSEQ